MKRIVLAILIGLSGTALAQGSNQVVWTGANLTVIGANPQTCNIVFRADFQYVDARSAVYVAVTSRSSNGAQVTATVEVLVNNQRQSSVISAGMQGSATTVVRAFIPNNPFRLTASTPMTIRITACRNMY